MSAFLNLISPSPIRSYQNAATAGIGTSNPYDAVYARQAAIGATPSTYLADKITPGLADYLQYQKSYVPEMYNQMPNEGWGLGQGPTLPLGSIDFNTWQRMMGAMKAAQPQANPFDFGGAQQAPYDALAAGRATPPAAYQNSSYDLLQQYLPAPFTAEANTPAPVPYAPIQVYNPYAPAYQSAGVANPYLSWGGK